MQNYFRRKRASRKIGLVLGSGGARGWAHLGVIRALEEAGFEVDCIAGTSIGALVGAALATDCHRALESMALNLQWNEIIYYFSDLSFSRSGLVDGRKMLDFIGKHIQSVCIEDLPVPYCAVATDIETGKEVVLEKGDLLEAVRASISVPGIFTPVKRGGRILVDGGLVNPVPVSVVRAMGAKFIVAVDVNQGNNVTMRQTSDKALSPESRPKDAERDEEERTSVFSRLQETMAKLDLGTLKSSFPWLRKDSSAPHLFDVLGNAIRILEAQVAASMLKADPPDLIIQPDVADIGFMEFNRAPTTIQAGYEAAREALKQMA